MLLLAWDELLRNFSPLRDSSSVVSFWSAFGRFVYFQRSVRGEKYCHYEAFLHTFRPSSVFFFLFGVATPGFYILRSILCIVYWPAISLWVSDTTF